MAILLAGLNLRAAGQPKPPDVEALLARLDDLYRSKSSIARIEIQVTTPRSNRFDTITGPMLGHVQVHAPERRRTRAMDRTLRGTSRLVDELRRDPEIASANHACTRRRSRRWARRALPSSS